LPLRPLAAAGVVVVLAGAVTGCVSTQDKAARLRLNSDRIRASQSATRVAAGSPPVSVDAVAVVSAGRGTAFVVTVRNASDRAVSDLPISVGYRRDRRRVYVNASDALGYFASHLPVIAAHRQFVWVYTGRRLPRHARPFAIVGGRPTVTAAISGSPPVIHAGTQRAGAGEVLEVAVRNPSGVPQYQLPVYAVAKWRGRATAAGVGTVKELDGGATQTLRLRLVGRLDQASVQLEAPATIAQ
jgi:hypothetical protein